MKKVSAVCIYQNNKIYNLTVNYKGSQIVLVHYNISDTQKPYTHVDFQDLYSDVLSLLKSNGFYCAKVHDFNVDWYDIIFINLDTPTLTSKMWHI